MSKWSMKPEHVEARRKWVEALLSGKYKQARGALRKGNAFCCLGVACDAVGVGVWQKDGRRWTFNGVGDLLPSSVIDRLGVRYPNPNACGNIVASLNDDQRFTFEEIATAILFEEEYQLDLASMDVASLDL
jgi:hypothetical protein